MTRDSLLKLLEKERTCLTTVEQFEARIVHYLHMIEDGPADVRQKYEGFLEEDRQNLAKANLDLRLARTAIRRYMHDLFNPEDIIRECKGEKNE